MIRRAALALSALSLVVGAVAVTPGPAGAGEPVKLMIFGDSMAYGLYKHLAEDPEWAGYEIVNTADGACNIGRGLILTYSRKIISSGVCDTWQTDWPQEIAQQDPDVVLMLTGGWDITDRYSQQPSSCSPGPWCPPPPFRISQEKGDNRYRKKLRQAVEVLGAGGATVLVGSEPYVNPKSPTPGPDSGLPSDFWYIHWEPYSDTKPEPTSKWPQGWKRPTKGATYISSRIKVDVLFDVQQGIVDEFASPQVQQFDVLELLSPGANKYARKICTPATVPPTTSCASEQLALVRTGDGYHVTMAGNEIISDALLETVQNLP